MKTEIELKKPQKIKLPKNVSIEELRWRRNLAASDGDMMLAMACASEITRKKMQANES